MVRAYYDVCAGWVGGGGGGPFGRLKPVPRAADYRKLVYGITWGELELFGHFAVSELAREWLFTSIDP